jgi:hypothetical protein
VALVRFCLGNQLVGYVWGIEVGKERRRRFSFVIQDLYFDMVTELAKERVGGGVSGALAGAGSVRKSFNTNVAFVDG